MNIWSSVTSDSRPIPTHLAIPTIVGVTIPSSGAAIVSVALDARTSFRHPLRTCSGIERLPFDVGKVAGRVKALDLGPHDLVIIDGAGAGQALWIALGSPRSRRFRLYGGLSRERQKLVDPVPAMMLDGTFTFAPDLPHQEAMLRALAGYRREVLDDGIVGNELAIALFLALGHRPPGRIRIY